VTALLFDRIPHNWLPEYNTDKKGRRTDEEANKRQRPIDVEQESKCSERKQRVAYKLKQRIAKQVANGPVVIRHSSCQFP
jgi:hypothetical protein